MALAFDSHGLSITSQVFPPSLTQIEGGDSINLIFHLDFNGTKINAPHANSSACYEVINSSVFINLVVTLPIVFDIVSYTNRSNQTGIITSNLSNCSFVPSLEINSSSSLVSNHMPGSKALNFHIISQNVSWSTTLNVILKLQHSARAASLLNITSNVTISNKYIKGDISIVSYRTPTLGNLQFESKSTSIPATPGLTLTSDEEITFLASFQIPRITVNVKLQVLLPVFRNSTPIKFLSGYVVGISKGVKPKLLVEGSGPRLSVSPLTAHLFPLTQNVAEFAFGETVNKRNESFNGTITVEVTGVVDSSHGVYIPDSDGNVTCVLIYDSPTGSHTIANKSLLTLKLGQPLIEFNLKTSNSNCCYEGKDIVEIEFEVKNPDFSTAPAWNFTLNISLSSADIVLRNFSAFLCSNISIFNMTSETECHVLNGTHMLAKAEAGLQVELTRLNASSWVHGRLYNYVKPSVAAGSFHSNNLIMEYTREGWLPIVDTDIETIRIKNVTSSTPSVISSDVSNPTGDPMDITIGEEVVLQAIVQIPVSTNPGFYLKLFGSGFDAVGGQIIAVGRNIKSLQKQIDAAYNLNASGSTVSSNLGTVVNAGNYTWLSESLITCTATMRVADVNQNTNGRRLAIVSDTIVDGRPQVPSSLTLKVILPDLLVTVTVNKIFGVNRNDDLTFTVQLSHSRHSASHAYRVLLEIAAPNEHFENVRKVGSPDVGVLSVVSGNNAPSGNLSHNDANTKVILYEVTNGLPLGNSTSFQYKAATVGNLQPNIYISSPVYLSYTTLPLSLSPRQGRKFQHNSDQATFRTFRPLPYVTVSFHAPANGSFDAGDKVDYELILNNIDSTIPAYSLSVVVTFETVDTNNLSTSCSKGSPSFNATTKQSRVFVTPLAPSESIRCKYESRLQARVGPKQLISQTVTVEYYNTDVGNNSQNAASYIEERHANITTKPIDTSILPSQNADKLQAGDPVNFTLRLQLPECETNLSVVVNLPTVPESVIDLARKRRSLQEMEIESKGDHLRSRRKRSSGVVSALSPVVRDSFVRYGDGLTLSLIPTITPLNPTTLTIAFGTVQNLPGSGSNDTIEIFLKFNTANRPLILSGRRLYLTLKLNFDAGSDSGVKQFVIIGPLVKPLLSVVKTVKIIEKNLDSPLVLFNITISHTNASSYDARNLTVEDSTQGMDFYDSDSSTQGAFVTSPRKNTFEIRFSLRSLRVGDTRSFIYVARFKVDEKEPTTLRIPAEVTWKSVQVNSLTYRVSSDASTSCLQRADVDEPERRKVFGYFALGVFLGLLIGALIAAILILVVIKCCDKGKMAPYYTRFTNTTTMTVLTGGSQYIYHGSKVPYNKPMETHKETSIVQTDESIVLILILDNAAQTEKEFNSLDVQATAALDADLEAQRQNMFIRALKLLAKKLRVKRDISSEQENKFALEIKQAIGAVAFKMAAEYRRRSAELRKRLTADGKNRLDSLHREQAKERGETKNKIKGLVNEVRRNLEEREKKNILELLKRRQDAQEQELKQNLKLEQDVEMEKLRKEISISKRFVLKESQNQLIQNLVKDAKLNEEQANAIMKNHLANMAAIDKATDEERARRVMVLEMRLAERRALAKQKHEEEERKKRDLGKLEQNHAEALENLVRSSNLNSEDAATYLERFRKDLEVVDNKLAKDRKRQEQKLHHKLTALKQKRIEEKVREHQREIKEFEKQQDEKFEQVEIDTVSSITEKQKILQKHQEEIEEIEKNSDREAAEEIEALRDQQTRDGNQMIKNNTQKMYQEVVTKGLSESDKEAILERHMADLAMQQDAREEERKRQREMLEKRLEKQRTALEKKMKEEQMEQAKIRKQEDKIVGDLIINQVAMSEEEREKIIQEHEKNLAALESSLTLNKLRQRQMLEDKLALRRKRRMEELERKQMQETKDRDYEDRILVEGEDIEIIKKHEQEKMAAMKEDELQIDDEMEMVRQEMLAERSKRLEEHHEKLGAIIANLQIEKAKQISKIAMQQQALGQLQAGLIDELESKGTFKDPETEKIMEKYQKDTKNLEDNLKVQKERQEKALRERLQERMRQREETLVQKQKDELTQYLNGLNVNNMAMKLRKAALKARHERERNEMRNRLQKEIDQSINELKMTFDIKRMRAVEEQNIKLISILVQQGKLQEDELESVLRYLFPKKSPNEIDELLFKIYGSGHTKGSKQTFTDLPRPSALEARIRRRSSIHVTTPPVIRKQSKKRKKSKKDQDELPPINFKGSKKGFNLNESIHGYRTLSDDKQNDSQRETDDHQHAPQRKGSYQQLMEENNQELVDEMFGDSPEKGRKKSGKKWRRRRPIDDDELVV